MSQRRHILIMSSWYPNRLDQFVGNFVQRFAELLSKDFHVSVIHTQGDASVQQMELIDQVENKVRVVRSYHPVSRNRLVHWWNQRKALNACFDLIEDVDLIFAHVLLPRAIQFTKAKHYYHRDLVVLEHGSYYRKEISGKLSPLIKRMLKRSSRHVEQFCAVSEVLADDIKHILPTAKPVIVPNFVDEELFTPAVGESTSRTRFLHISTLDKVTKNPVLLFEGFRQAYERNKRISLTVISDQSTEKWQQWAKEHGLEDAIRWVGPSNWEAIAAEMQQHDCVLVTSTYETFNIVLAEAWCTGLPVISTKVGIAAEMDHELGISLVEHSPEALCNAIETFTSGALHFEKKTIRKHGLKFGKATVLEQLKTIFEPHFKAYE